MLTRRNAAQRHGGAICEILKRNVGAGFMAVFCELAQILPKSATIGVLLRVLRFFLVALRLLVARNARICCGIFILRQRLLRIVATLLTARNARNFLRKGLSAMGEGAIFMQRHGTGTPLAKSRHLLVGKSGRFENHPIAGLCASCKCGPSINDQST
jgi:hypothetical protein